MVTEIKSCRLCGSSKTTDVLNWGRSPIANAFKSQEDLDKEEFASPLVYFKCDECHSVQLRHEVDSWTLYKDYLYETPKNLIPHFKELVQSTIRELNLPKENRVIDIGSNNGLLLKEYQNLGFDVVGFEPAAKIAQKANDNGIPTINEFFNPETAKTFAFNYLKADLVVATNVFAHSSDLDWFVESVKLVLAKTGYFVFENAYLLNTLRNKDLGQSYLDHHFQYHVSPLVSFFERHGLEFFKVTYNDVQMGSIRGFVRFKDNQTLYKDDSVEKAIESEKKAKLCDNLTYLDFISYINQLKDGLLTILDNAKAKNKSISIYGWPAKMTLLNSYFGLEKYIDYVIEESPIKLGKFCPGTNLEIKSLDYFKANPTDLCILGAYNFENDIKEKNKWFNGEWVNPLKYILLD